MAASFVNLDQPVHLAAQAANILEVKTDENNSTRMLSTIGIGKIQKGVDLSHSSAATAQLRELSDSPLSTLPLTHPSLSSSNSGSSTTSSEHSTTSSSDFAKEHLFEERNNIFYQTDNVLLYHLSHETNASSNFANNNVIDIADSTRKSDDTIFFSSSPKHDIEHTSKNGVVLLNLTANSLVHSPTKDLVTHNTGCTEKATHILTKPTALHDSIDESEDSDDGSEDEGDGSEFEVLIYDPAILMPLPTQIAGHGSEEGDGGKGFLKRQDGKLLKPIQAPPRGPRELEFYRSMNLSDDPSDIKLLSCIPEFFGVEKVGFRNGITVMEEFLILRDITENMVQPAVMDIKIGSRTWGPDASAKKQAQEDSKYVDTKHPYGFR